MEGSARFVVRHRWWVVGFWLIALLAGGLTAGKLQPRLSADFSLPGQEGSQTQAKLAQYDHTGSTAYAVEHGLGRTGRLVTSAALILFFAFAALSSAPGTDIKVMATALGVGILLDATIVRALLVPALVSLFGKYNWWLPAGIAKLLRVEPSPLKPDVVPPTGYEPEQDALTAGPRGNEALQAETEPDAQIAGARRTL